MASTAPKLGIKYAWALGENGWNTDMDNNLKKLDVLVMPAVETRTLTSPPGSPTNGNAFIIPLGATGVWAGKTNQIAHYIAGAWTYYVPQEGWNVWIKDEDLRGDFNGTSWIVTAPLSAVSALTPLNSWANNGSTFASASYYTDGSGIAYLRGCIKPGAGAVILDNTPLVQLPVGTRVTTDLLVPAITDKGACCLAIKSSGNVELLFLPAGASWLSLDGISFRPGI